MIALALWLAGALGITGNVLNMILNSSFWINKSLSFFFLNTGQCYCLTFYLKDPEGVLTG